MKESLKKLIRQELKEYQISFDLKDTIAYLTMHIELESKQIKKIWDGVEKMKPNENEKAIEALRHHIKDLKKLVDKLDKAV
jgi:hypothetical protein